MMIRADDVVLAKGHCSVVHSEMFNRRKLVYNTDHLP